MTTMEATLGLREFYPFGHVPEPLPNALARKKQLKLLLHTQNLWFSHTHVCNVHRKLSDDDIYGLCRQMRASSLALSASLIAVPTSPEESTIKLAAENAYNSPSIEPHMESFLESTPSKSHPNKRRHFPANGVSVLNCDSHALFGENPDSALISDEDTSFPSEAVVMCFKCLEITGVSLRKCLKHASSVSEDDIVSLLKTLSSYGFSRSDIKSMFAKYPPLVKVKGPQIEQCFLYYSGLEFSRNIVTALLLKRPALLACDLERASQVIDYLLSMGITKEDLSSIIACRPHIFEHDVAVLKSIVSALMKARLDQSEINRLIKRSPSVFTAAQEDIERSLSFWSDVGVEGKALSRAILRRPNLLSYNTASMLATYKYLQWWFDRSDLTKLVTRFAELLAYDPQTKLKPLIDYFLELGLSEGEVAKVILRRPQLMTCTLERLKRFAEFLTSLGMKDDMVGKVLIASPQVFTLNTEDKLKRGVEFFRSMGLKKEKDLEYVFARSAQLFCCSIEKNLQPTIKFFSDTGLEKEDLSAMIVAFPSMLGQSIDLSLAPKYGYLVGEMKRTNKELVEFPQYFGYSLERRIKPRHRLLSERGLHKSLPSMLACKDNDFLKRYIEPYSPLPPQTAIGEGDPTEHVFPKKQKLKRKKAVVPPAEVLADAIRQDPSTVASEQETLPMVGGSEVHIAEDRIAVVKEEWEFLNFIPQQVSFGSWLHKVPTEVLADAIGQDPSTIASEQETLPMVGGSEVHIAEDRIDVVKEEWEFLNFIPQPVSLGSWLHKVPTEVLADAIRQDPSTVTSEQETLPMVSFGSWLHKLPAEVLADAIRQDPSTVASEQETLPMVGGSEVHIAEDRIDVVKEEWGFLNFIPQLEQSHLYPASFRKHYKNLTPCGKWIHAYKFDTQ